MDRDFVRAVARILAAREAARQTGDPEAARRAAERVLVLTAHRAAQTWVYEHASEAEVDELERVYPDTSCPAATAVLSQAFARLNVEPALAEDTQFRELFSFHSFQVLIRLREVLDA